MTESGGSSVSVTNTRSSGRISFQRLIWGMAMALEAGVIAYSMGRIIFGPVSLSPHPLLWVTWVLAAAFAYAGLSALAVWPMLRAPTGTSRNRLWTASLPFLAVYLAGLTALQLRPDSVKAVVWSVLSPIEPFPTMAAALLILLVFLAKCVVVGAGAPGDTGSGHRDIDPAGTGVIIALVVLGVLQASVYILPVGNAFLRSWAVTDAVITGTPYPVTITEPPTFLAGGPPYIRDLPLFPLMLLGSFQLLGHNTLAAHIPPFLASSLFPLSLYLLLKEAVSSRFIALAFAAIVSMFPFLRFWVLNLPDPDPVMLTGLCIAGYLYLRAFSAPWNPYGWLAAGLAGGLLSLVRSEGILYAGFMALAVVASRPGLRQVASLVAGLALPILPMIAVWFTSFGILWPQNFNGTLGPRYPMENLEILRAYDAFGIYQRGIGLDAAPAVTILAICLATVVWGVLAACLRQPRLLALLVPGIGNFVSVFFTSPGVTNAQHFADFFRHASFGLPYMALASAYGLSVLWSGARQKSHFRLAGYAVALLLLAVVVREGDILANPTATHRPGATQVLTTSTHLSMDAIAEHPLALPLMTYHWNGQVTVAYPEFMEWPEGILEYFKPLDMSFDSAGRPFGYASLAAFLVAAGFVALRRK